MRIIGGSAAGRILKVPKGLDVRPTPDLVKQAIFNSLGARVMDATVLELFAGSGALGLECLSRGAAHVVSVEKANRHARMISENLKSLDLPSHHFDLRVQDAFQAIHQFAAANHQFDLVIADPPYGEKNVGRRSESFAQRLLDQPDLPSLLRPDGLLLLGHARRDTITVTDSWHERKLLRHGDSIFRFLARQEES